MQGAVTQSVFMLVIGRYQYIFNLLNQLYFTWKSFLSDEISQLASF